MCLPLDLAERLEIAGLLRPELLERLGDFVSAIALVNCGDSHNKTQTQRGRLTADQTITAIIHHGSLCLVVSVLGLKGDWTMYASEAGTFMIVFGDKIALFIIR